MGLLKGDKRKKTPKQIFDDLTEEAMYRKMIKDFLNEEFKKQSNSAQWKMLGIEEVKG